MRGSDPQPAFAVPSDIRNLPRVAGNTESAPTAGCVRHGYASSIVTVAPVAFTASTIDAIVRGMN